MFESVMWKYMKEEKDLLLKTFNTKLEKNRAFLKCVVSRKKQLLPFIDKNI